MWSFCLSSQPCLNMPLHVPTYFQDDKLRYWSWLMCMINIISWFGVPVYEFIDTYEFRSSGLCHDSFFFFLTYKWVIVVLRKFFLLAYNFHILIRNDVGVSGKSTSVITASGSSERFMLLHFLFHAILYNKWDKHLQLYVYFILARRVGSNQNILIWFVPSHSFFFFFFFLISFLCRLLHFFLK